MKNIRIALAQINPVVGDLKGNNAKILEFVGGAQDHGVDLLIFPELSLCGYPPEDLLLREDFVTRNLLALKQVSSKIDNIAVVLGCLDRDKEGNLYNSAAIIRGKKVKGIYHKIELPNYGVFDEKRYFKQGQEVCVFELGGVNFGLTICEDIWTDKVVRQEKKLGAQVILNISASPYHMGKSELRQETMRRRVKESDVYICYSNLVGAQDELVFDGGSFVLDRKGQVAAQAKQFIEDLFIYDLDVEGKNVAQSPKRLSLGVLLKEPKPLIGVKKAGALNILEEVYQALVLGTRDYVCKNGFKKVVVGLSGGIDSALTAVIACDAIGKENVVSVSMPSRYSSGATQNDARKLADNLGIKFIKVGIDKILDRYLENLRDEFKGLPYDITEENLQARIRGNLLMAFSNKFGWLVLTTGNKSEVSCGYCTLYGDMAGGFNILKDVYKTLVYDLAKFRNQKEDRELIFNSIIERPPTAELRPNQKDQDTLPPYPVLDKILKCYIEEEKSCKKIVSRDKLSAQLVRKVISMVDRSEYKRRQSAPGIKITPRAFGKDRRMPITNGAYLS